jgi:hypothetical protein
LFGQAEISPLPSADSRVKTLLRVLPVNIGARALVSFRNAVGTALAKGSLLKCESVFFFNITVIDKGLFRRKPVRAHTYQPTSRLAGIWQWEFPKDFPKKAFSTLRCSLLREPLRERALSFIDEGDVLFFISAVYFSPRSDLNVPPKNSKTSYCHRLAGLALLGALVS